MNRKVIVIAGTPGVGKTSVSERLASVFGYRYVNLSKLAIEKNLLSHYDEDRQTYVIDETSLVNEVLRIINEYKYVVIDTHYPEILPPDIVDLVIVLRLNPFILENKLRERGWSGRKVNENVMAEILSIVTVNAIERFGENKVFEIDVTGRTVDEIIEIIIDIVENKCKHTPGQIIDWLTVLKPEEITRYEY
uniref:Putative adenylate kinase n=1 Tax=Staphylothermus marinus TaxID=2280 RepID=A0A7C4D6C6_STAMA